MEKWNLYRENVTIFNVFYSSWNNSFNDAGSLWQALQQSQKPSGQRQKSRLNMQVGFVHL